MTHRTAGFTSARGKSFAPSSKRRLVVYGAIVGLLLPATLAASAAQAQSSRRNQQGQATRRQPTQQPGRSTQPGRGAPSRPGQTRPGQTPPAGAQRQGTGQPVEASAAMKTFRAAYELTRSARSAQDLTEIIEMCQKALQVGVTQAEAKYANSLLAWTYNRRGEVQAKAGHDEMALADFETAVQLDGSRWNAYHNRGVSFGMAGDLDAALADFNRVIELNPNYAKAFYNRGELRFRKGDLAGAQEDYTRCLRLSPRDSAALTSRGFVYYRQGDYRNAIRDFGQAIQADRSNAEAYTHRGDAYADQAQFAQALNDFQMALRANPNYGKAYQSSAWLRATCPSAQFRNADLALRSAQKAIELDGEGDYRYLEALAAAQANAEQMEAAKLTQNKAVATATAAGADKAAVERAQERLRIYESGKPYRDVLPGAPQPR